MNNDEINMIEIIGDSQVIAPFKERYKIRTYEDGTFRVSCELVLKEDWETQKKGDIVAYGVTKTKTQNPNEQLSRSLAYARAMRIFMLKVFNGEREMEDVRE